jgi:hypothetical protein
MGPVFFVLSNVFAATCAYVTADMTMKDREPWRRALATTAGFPIVVLFVVLSLGNVGHLSAGSIVLMVGVMASAAMGVRWYAAKNMRAVVPRKHQNDCCETDPLIRPMSIALMAGFGGGWVVLLSFWRTDFAWDDLSYHATAVAHWIVDGQISLAPQNYHAYYPFNAEVISLWFMLPFRADGLASLSGLYWGILLVVAGAALVVAQGHTRATATFVGALMLVSPVLLQAAQTFSAVDLAGSASVLAALALAIPSRANQTRTAHFADAAYAGLLAGFATGCKVSFAPVPAIIFVWQMFGWRRYGHPGAAIWSAVIFAAAAVTTGTYWYARNWLLTGNPVFPAALGPFDGPFGAAEQSRTKLIHWILAAPTDLGMWFSLGSHVNWSFGLFLLATVGYSMTLWTLVRNWQTLNTNNSAIPLLLLLTGLVLLVIYPFMPFTGTANDPQAPLEISKRFLIAPFAIGMVLFASCLRRDHHHRTFWICVAILAVASAEQTNRLLSFVIMGAGSISLLLWLRMRRMIFPSHFNSALRIAALPGIVLLIALLAPYKQRLTDFGIYAYGSPQHPIGRAWQAIDRLPTGSRVAWLGRSAYQYYPIFGRSLQLTPIAINSDGSSQQPMHEVFRRKHIQWWGDDQDGGDLSNLVPNLVSNDVAYVLISKWDQDKWPPEQEFLANSGQAESIYDDGYSAIWKIGSMIEQPSHPSEGGDK